MEAIITLTDAFILFLAWAIYMTLHESLHHLIYKKSGAKPRLIFDYLMLFDVVVTRKPRKLSQVEMLQMQLEIISYTALGFLIGLFCILWTIFK